MSESKTVVLIDGHALAYRSYFALERTNMRNSQNVPTWAVYGFFKAFFDLLDHVQPDALAISFDVSRKSFRTEMFEDYKAHRPPMPDDMRTQMSLLRRGIEALNIPIFEKEGVEADDVIGTLAEKISAEGHNVIILTGDQDSFQLLDNQKVRVLVPSKGTLTNYGKQEVFEKMGIYPEQIVDYKALRGDTSDNIPGVRGIGDKTAVTLLTEFNDLDTIYENLDKITKKRQKQLLEEGKEIAYLSRDLARIKRDVELDYEFKCCCLDKPNIEEFTAFAKELEFRSFLAQIKTLFDNFNSTETCEGGGKIPKEGVEKITPEPDAVSLKDGNYATFRNTVPETYKHSDNNNQLGLFDTKSVQSEPETMISKKIIQSETDLKELIKSLEAQTVISVDLETDSLKVLEANIVGIALSWPEKEMFKIENNKLTVTEDALKAHAAYIPVGHTMGDQVDKKSVIEAIKPLLEGTKVAKVLHNAKFDMHVFKNVDITLGNVIMDTMLASYVEDPGQGHGLKDLSMRKFKHAMTDYTEVAGKGKNQTTLDKIEIETVAAYAFDDAAMTLKLAHYYAQKLDKEQLSLLYSIEMPLLFILIDMEREGIALNKGYLQELDKELIKLIADLEEKIYKEANYPSRFNINSPKQLGDVLFEHMGIPAKTKNKTKTGYSTSQKVLESIAEDYKIGQLILEYRHLTKLKSTYVDALPKLINARTGRIHTSFNQAVTTTGRLSSSDPNLQNIPIKSEIGNRIRKAFIPNNSSDYLVAADYSQVELRFLADMSHEETLIKAFKEGADIHTTTASKIFRVNPEDVTKEMRRQAKVVNFGIIYGQTAFGLASTLGIDRKEAKSFIDKYFETYPRIQEYMENTLKKVRQSGYVSTKLGRKRYFYNDLSSSNRAIKEFAERAAINAPIQGSSADLMKLAMIQLAETFKKESLKAKMLIQVHDEIIIEVPPEELETVKKLVKSIMENAFELSVPLIADVSVGKDWMEAK